MVSSLMVAKIIITLEIPQWGKPHNLYPGFSHFQNGIWPGLNGIIVQR